jgi:hypothetical protein
MLSWAGLDGDALIECGFTGAGTTGTRPQYLISSPNAGMSQLTMLATINQGTTGVLDCDVISENTTMGAVLVKWTGGIGHSVSNIDTPNDFVATTSTTVP